MTKKLLKITTIQAKTKQIWTGIGMIAPISNLDKELAGEIFGEKEEEDHIKLNNQFSIMKLFVLG